MSLTPDVPGLDRYERAQERAKLDAEAAAEARLERMDEDVTDEQFRYDLNEDYIRERVYIEGQGEEW